MASPAATTPADPLALFGNYMKMVGVPELDWPGSSIPTLQDKTIGVVNGSTWVSLWSYFFGRKHLPGVKLASVGNEAVQLNFMQAHHKGEPVPPQTNIDLFAAYAKQLTELFPMDALVVTCSTMNRAIGAVREAVADKGIPVIQVDEAMMTAAVDIGGKALVIATHGPTVANTPY